MNEDLGPGQLRNAFGRIPSSVAAVCGLVDDAPTGFVVSTFTPVSLSPPIVSVCVQSTSTTWPKLQDCDRLGVSLLSIEQEREGKRLSLKGEDRFEGVEWVTMTSGALFLLGAVVWLECSFREWVEAGDHGIVLFDVHNVYPGHSADPLVFHSSRFRQLHE